MRPGRLHQLFLALLVGAALFSFLFTKTLLYSNNTLGRYTKWFPAKILVAYSTMGVEYAVSSRQMLAGNTLNLNEWYGNHEFLLNRVVKPARVSFSFFLDKKSYAYFIFNKDKDGWSALRFSTDPRFPSMACRATLEGKFLARTPLPFSIGAGWHKARVDFDDNELTITVDGSVAKLIEARKEQQLVGFRGGLNPAKIDNVVITDARGLPTVEETFEMKRGFAKIWACMFLFCFFSSAAFLFIANRLFVDWHKGALALLMLQGTLIVCLSSYFLFDFYYWSRVYHFKKAAAIWVFRKRDTLSKADQLLEKMWTNLLFVFPKSAEPFEWPIPDFLRLKDDSAYAGIFLKVLDNETGKYRYTRVEYNDESVKEFLQEMPMKSGVRVLLLGTSQLWGAGAYANDQRIEAYLFDTLAKHLPGRKIYVINASVRGSRAGPLFEEYQKFLYLFKPQVVLMNFGNNNGPVGLVAPVEGMIKLTQSSGGHPIISLEANSNEGVQTRLLHNHRTLRRIAETKKLLVADLHGYLNSKDIYDSGVLWWDIVHLTSYGQMLAGRFLGEAVAEEIKRDKI